MRPAHVVEIETPKKVLLNGLWFGPLKPKRVFIFVHGLTGSAFSMRGISETLVDQSSAVFTFNNRGFEQVGSLKKMVGKKISYIPAGAAHEIFTDCVDDIDGAVAVARISGASEIFLVGHSTGAQKCIYWAHTHSTEVQGIILLGPLSDYSGALKTMDPALLKKGVAHARKLIAEGKPHELMPAALREWFACDAQRYISLYTPDTAEDIFPYAFPAKVPHILESVTIPILVILAGKDEYGDKPPRYIAQWFAEHISEGEVHIIPKVSHSFKDGQAAIQQIFNSWVHSS